MALPHLFSGAILEDRAGHILLQLRDDTPGLPARGMIATFGGGGEGDETPLACLVRELKEELDLLIPPERFFHLLEAETLRDERAVRTYFFGLTGLDTAGMTVHEGTLMRLPRNGTMPFERMVPNCRRALIQFLERTS